MINAIIKIMKTSSICDRSLNSQAHFKKSNYLIKVELANGTNQGEKAT